MPCFCLYFNNVVLSRFTLFPFTYWIDIWPRYVKLLFDSITMYFKFSVRVNPEGPSTFGLGQNFTVFCLHSQPLDVTGVMWRLNETWYENMTLQNVEPQFFANEGYGALAISRSSENLNNTEVRCEVILGNGRLPSQNSLIIILLDGKTS